jgi:hypothetical protein
VKKIPERLEIFYQCLASMPPAKTAEEAMNLVCRTIEEVEDEFCPLPREVPPPKLRFTGRMYAPQADRIYRLEHGGLLAETRRHRIFCQPDGSIRIEDADEETVAFVKNGKKS